MVFKQILFSAPSAPLTSLQCGSLLQSFANTKSVLHGQKLHAYIISSGVLLNNTYLHTKLSAFYAVCGLMADARLLFDEIPLKNSFLWNSMIRGYASSSSSSFNSLVLYRDMISLGYKPDNFTFPFVLKACADLTTAVKVHSHLLVSGFHSDIYVANSLLSVYSRFGDMGVVRKLFDTMVMPDITSWNTLISGYAKNHHPLEAINVFNSMPLKPDCTTLVTLLPVCADLMALKQGKQIHGFILKYNVGLFDIRLINSLIDMYFKCDFIVGATKLFDNMITRDIVTWNSMILGYAKSAGHPFESLRFFFRMISQDVHPDQVTFTTILGASAQISALQFGASVHSVLAQKGLVKYTIVGTALVDMYAKCGSLDCSYRIFNEITEKNLVSWSAMIGGFGLHGRGREAITVFTEMKAKGIIPDNVTITTVLSACSHAGLVDEGRIIFNQMVNEYGITPISEHYSCMVDLLGRAGYVDEAYEFIKAMKVEPTIDVWATLLSACRAQRNTKLAEIAARKVFDLNPRRVASYVLLSNIYAVEKQWEDVETVRSTVRNMELKKQPGCSFIELDKVVHWFIVGDKGHPQSKNIYAKLEDLRQQLQYAGYTPDTSSVLYDVGEDVKEKMLWDHSERLAIALALIHPGSGTVIRISKNLRVCGDCHTVFKFISKLTGREIIMRDARRFHHFKNGVCSCGDYW